MDYSRMWGKIEDRIRVQQPRLNAYSERDNPDYHRNTFIDTECNTAKVHSYQEMRLLLAELQSKYPKDAEMFSAGKSEGYGSPDNALDVWGIHLYAIEKSEQTAFFVA